MKSFAIASIILLTTAPSFADPEVPEVESPELGATTPRLTNWNGGSPSPPATT